MNTYRMNEPAAQSQSRAATNIINLSEPSLPKELDNLKVSELRLLLALSNAKIGDWIPMSALRGDAKPTSSLSRSITKLSANQWISTKRDPIDGRGKQLRLSIQGRHRLKPLITSAKKKASNDLFDILPQTTRRHYLTSKTALNIPSEEGTGDWHFFEMFQGSHGRQPGPFFIAGINHTNTFHILRDFGVEEYTSLIHRLGVETHYPVFAANHYRAMADLIYHRLQENQGLASYQADEWFPAEEDREKLGNILKKLIPHLNDEQRELLTTWLREQNIV